MKKILFIFLILFAQIVEAQRIANYFNGLTGTYSTRPRTTERVTWIGQINPAELASSGFESGYDIWQIEIPKCDSIININSGNIANIQSIIAALPSNRICRLFFQASGGLPTVYRNVSFNCGAKNGLQIVGETDASGNPLVTLNGSILLTSWTSNAGKWEHNVSNYALAFTDADDSTRCISGQRCAVEQALYYNNRPLIPRLSASAVAVGDTTSFFYNSATGKVTIGFNPATRTLEWSNLKSAIHCGETAGSYPNLTNFVSVKSLNFIQYGGNSLCAVVGGRGYSNGGGVVAWGWLVKDCTFNANGGVSILLHSRSTAINNRVSNSGIMSISSQYPGTAFGYSTNITTNILNNLVENDNWKGFASSYANGLKIVGQYRVNTIGNTVRNAGNVFWNRFFITDGIWYDYVYFGRIANNTVYNGTGNGIQSEASCDITIENNYVFDCAIVNNSPAPHGFIYHVTGNRNTWRNNRAVARLLRVRDNYEIRLFHIRKSQAVYGGNLFIAGDNFNCTNNTWQNNDYTFNNQPSQTTYQIENIDTPPTSPVQQWFITNTNVSSTNIFRGISTLVTPFQMPGLGNYTLSGLQGLGSSNFEVSSTIN